MIAGRESCRDKANRLAEEKRELGVTMREQIAKEEEMLQARDE